MSNFSIIVTTTDKRKEAEFIVEEIVKNRLASCGQIFEIESTYWWEGKLECAKEFRIELKTRSNLVKKVVHIIKSIHSYSVPEIIVIPIIYGHKDYLNWIKKETENGYKF